MIRLIGLALLLAAPATADEPAQARRLPLALAVEAAQGSIAACHAQGYHVVVEIKDAAGVTVAILADDGAASASIAAVRQKNLAVLKDRVASSVGGVPLLAQGAFLGAYGVAGAPTGEADEACARAGLSRIAARMP